MIALVDYGAGNLASVRKALETLGARAWTPAAAADLRRASGIIVPGVGHFSATAALDERWRSEVGGALERRVPLLGICVGMQWLFEGSDEAPGVPGLGVLAGRCVRLPDRTSEPPVAATIKVPHVGWNLLTMTRHGRLLDGVPDGAFVYFTHAYAAPVGPATAAVATHGVPFSAAVEDGLVSGVQFHPEKSGDVGLRILRNWLTQVAR